MVGELPGDGARLFSELRKPLDSLYEALVLRHIEEIKEKRRAVYYHGPSLPYGPENVWGVGFGFKWFPRHPWGVSRKGVIDHATGLSLPGIPCIKVFVVKTAKNPEEVQSRVRVDLVKQELNLPWVETEVVELGLVFASGGPHPIQVPGSGGNINNPGGGTIGAVVEDRHGNAALLSCAHVFVDFDQPTERRVVQPSRHLLPRGPVVAELKDHTMGQLSAGVYNADAAIATPVQGFEATPHQYPAIRDPVLGPQSEVVRKVGSTTGLTEGVVSSPLTRIAQVPYHRTQIDFEEVYIVGAYGSYPHSPFSMPGDSGAVVEGVSDGAALGVVTANTTRIGYECIMFTAQNVVRRLRIRL